MANSRVRLAALATLFNVLVTSLPGDFSLRTSVFVLCNDPTHDIEVLYAFESLDRAASTVSVERRSADNSLALALVDVLFLLGTFAASQFILKSNRK